MRELDTIPDAPPPGLRFRRKVGLLASLRDLWRSRELVVTLTERELRVRYKQAILGVLWALAQPLSLIVVFTVIFRHVTHVETHGVPYALFSFMGLLAWNFFSSSVGNGGLALFNNAAVLNRVYCPREVFPLASVGVAAADAMTSLLALPVLFLATGYAPKATSYWTPLLALIQVSFTVAVTLIISAVVVQVRDIRHALPIVIQVGLFATPVAFGIDNLRSPWLQVYAAANPLVAVIDGYRRAVLLGTHPDWSLVLPAAAASVLLLLAGIRLFKRLEGSFADLI